MLIILDFDGVLRSIPWEGLFEGYKALIEYKGKNQDAFFNGLDEFKAWYNKDFMQNLVEIGGFEKDEYGLVDEIFHAHYDKYTRIFPWVPKLLKELSKKHNLALLSSSSHDSIHESLGGLRRYFSGPIFGSDDIDKRIKPSPYGVHLIVEEMGADYDNTVIIGDSDADVLAGKNAGIKTGVVGWGIYEWEKLLSLNPDYKFKNPEDLFLL